MKNFNVLCILVISLNVLTYSSARPIQKPCGYGSAEYVLIIGIDGLGGVHLQNATDKLPGLRSFFEQGSHTSTARCHNPTLSGSNWGSVLTGMTPEETGINNNAWRPNNGRQVRPGSQNHVKPISGEGIPETMFKAAKKQNENITTYMSFSWDWIVHLYTPSSVDRLFRAGWQVVYASNWQGPLTCPLYFTNLECAILTDNLVFNDTLWTIKSLQPNLMFTYLGLVDQAGHDFYWGGPEYYSALDTVDKYVQGIINALNNTKTPTGEAMIDKTLLMVTSDHGGYLNSHAFCRKRIFYDSNSDLCASYNTPSTLEIPVLLRGPGIKNNFTMNKTLVTNRDLAATALNALGLNKGEYMSGRVLEEAYEMVHCPSESTTENDCPSTNTAKTGRLPTKKASKNHPSATRPN